MSRCLRAAAAAAVIAAAVAGPAAAGAWAGHHPAQADTWTAPPARA